MPLPFFASGYHLYADQATMAREALALSTTVAFADDDPWGLGGRRLRINSGGGVALPAQGPDPGTTWHLSFGYRSQTSGGIDAIAIVPRGSGGEGTVVVWIRAPAGSPPARRLQIYLKGSLLHEYALGSAVDPALYRIDVVEHASEGIIRAYRNDVLSGEYQDLDTSRGFTYDRISLGAGASVNSQGDHWHTMLLPGLSSPARFVGHRAPNSDEGPNDFTRSDGEAAHYEHVDDVPHDGDTTTLTSGGTGVGDRTRHGLAALREEARQVIALRPVVVATGPATVAAKVLSGEADPESTSLDGFEEGYTVRGGDWLDEDPDTTAPWTLAGAEAVQVEVEHVEPES